MKKYSCLDGFAFAPASRISVSGMQLVVLALMAGMTRSSHEAAAEFTPYSYDTDDDSDTVDETVMERIRAEYEDLRLSVADQSLIDQFTRGEPLGSSEAEVHLKLREDDKVHLEMFLDMGGDFMDPFRIHIAYTTFFHTQKAAKLELAPIIYAVGDPVALPRNPTSEYPFTLDPREWRTVHQRKSKVISLIVETPGLCLSDLKVARGGALSLIEALEIGLDLLNKIRILHTEAHMVHGALSPDAICQTEGDKSKFIFTRFQTAYLINPHTSEEIRFRGWDRITEDREFGGDRFSSMAQVLGHPPVMRDEVFRVLSIVVWLTQKHPSDPPSLGSPISHWFEWKKRFQFYISHKVKRPKLPVHALREMKAIREEITNRAFGDTSIVPDYDFFIIRFERMLYLLRFETL